MSPEIPKLKHVVWMLRKFRDSEGLSNAQLATSMTTFGWTWTEDFLDKLFIGTINLDSEKKEFCRAYMLDYLIDAL